MQTTAFGEVQPLGSLKDALKRSGNFLKTDRALGEWRTGEGEDGHAYRIVTEQGGSGNALVGSLRNCMNSSYMLYAALKEHTS